MAEILIFHKFVYAFLIMGYIPLLAQVAHQEPLNAFASVIIIVLMIITLLPQLMLVFPAYREQLLTGIQDADGVTNREDLKFFASISIPFLSFQVLVLLTLFNEVTGREMSDMVFWGFVALTTGTALPQVKGLIRGNKSSN